MVEDHLKSLVLKHFDPQKADLIFTEEGSVLLPLLSQLCLQPLFPIFSCSLSSFPPPLPLSLFLSPQTPTWLEEMVQYGTWRDLFYQLAEQYPDCLMLKFTIKLISDAGFQSEIKSASTASHQPEVYSGLVRSALAQITVSPPTKVQESLAEFTVSYRN